MFRPKQLPLALLLAASAGGLLIPVASSAQRRIVGGDDLEDEDSKEKEEAEAAKKAREEAAKKKAEEDAKKAEANKQKAAERKAAEEAARQAAIEAKKKKQEEEERKKEEAVNKEKARLEGNRAGRLQAAKKERRITRVVGNHVVTITLIPGAPQPGQVQEIRFDVAEKLKVASVQYGNLKPVAKAALVATVSPPDTGGDEEPVRYTVHNLPTPGAFGIHFTPSREGEFPVKLEGKTGAGDDVTAEFAVHAGVWPPPDFDTEEGNNKATDSLGGSGRRVAGGG